MPLDRLRFSSGERLRLATQRRNRERLRIEQERTRREELLQEEARRREEDRIRIEKEKAEAERVAKEKEEALGERGVEYKGKIFHVPNINTTSKRGWRQMMYWAAKTFEQKFGRRGTKEEINQLYNMAMQKKQQLGESTMSTPKPYYVDTPEGRKVVYSKYEAEQIGEEVSDVETAKLGSGTEEDIEEGDRPSWYYSPSQIKLREKESFESAMQSMVQEQYETLVRKEGGTVIVGTSPQVRTSPEEFSEMVKATQEVRYEDVSILQTGEVPETHEKITKEEFEAIQGRGEWYTRLHKFEKDGKVEYYKEHAPHEQVKFFFPEEQQADVVKAVAEIKKEDVRPLGALIGETKPEETAKSFAMVKQMGFMPTFIKRGREFTGRPISTPSIFGRAFTFEDFLGVGTVVEAGWIHARGTATGRPMIEQQRQLEASQIYGRVAYKVREYREKPFGVDVMQIGEPSKAKGVGALTIQKMTERGRKGKDSYVPMKTSPRFIEALAVAGTEITLAGALAPKKVIATQITTKPAAPLMSANLTKFVKTGLFLGASELALESEKTFYKTPTAARTQAMAVLIAGGIAYSEISPIVQTRLRSIGRKKVSEEILISEPVRTGKESFPKVARGTPRKQLQRASLKQFKSREFQTPDFVTYIDDAGREVTLPVSQYGKVPAKIPYQTFHAAGKPLESKILLKGKKFKDVIILGKGERPKEFHGLFVAPSGSKHFFRLPYQQAGRLSSPTSFVTGTIRSVFAPYDPRLYMIEPKGFKMLSTSMKTQFKTLGAKADVSKLKKGYAYVMGYTRESEAGFVMETAIKKVKGDLTLQTGLFRVPVEEMITTKVPKEALMVAVKKPPITSRVIESVSRYSSQVYAEPYSVPTSFIPAISSRYQPTPSRYTIPTPSYTAPSYYETTYAKPSYAIRGTPSISVPPSRREPIIREVPSYPYRSPSYRIPVTRPLLPPVIIREEILERRKPVEREEEREVPTRSFRVQVTQKGKFITVGKPMTRQDALDFGSEVVDNSASGTFRLLPSPKPPEQVKVSRGYFADNSSKFRTFLRRRGKKIPVKNTWIEKETHRIDSEGEKRGITAFGWIAQRKKGRAISIPRGIEIPTGRQVGFGQIGQEKSPDEVLKMFFG